MDTIWTTNCTIPRRESLQSHIQTEVAIIGAGLAGILIGYELQKSGKQVVLLEAKQIASGQTSHTTAKITSQHGFVYHHLIKHFGEKLARQYAIANEKAITHYRLLIKQEQIDCDFEEKDSYIYSDDMELLQKEFEAVTKLGLPAFFVPSTSLPIPAASAIQFESQAQFHPLKFIKSISECLTIYENTLVLSVEDNLIKTEQGTVRANSIVFATHFPFINFPGMYFTRMHQERSYVLALKHAPKIEGMFLGKGANAYSLRNYKDFLLFGGENHRCGEHIKGGHFDALRQKAKEWFPNSVEIGHWSAQDCISVDSVPYIGHYSSKTPNWYVATGFQKWGMTSSMVSALILKDLICGYENSYATIFSPNRFTPSDLLNITKEGGMAVKGLLKRTLQLPEHVIEDLPCGHGEIVLIADEKIGVYKDDNGTVYPVTIRCPHLGCQLEWNPDEKSWDCPCHGSRFDYHGNWISNPAQTNISISSLS